MFREVVRAEVETKVMFEWNSAYMECSAKLGGQGVNQVFTELLQRARNNGEFCVYHHYLNYQNINIF